jgi:hypothetical protein
MGHMSLVSSSFVLGKVPVALGLRAKLGFAHPLPHVRVLRCE